MNFFKYQTFTNSSQDYRYNLDPRSFCINNDLQTIYNSSSDDLWIDSWLTQNQLYKKNVQTTKKPINLQNTRESLQKIKQALEKLELHQATMQQEIDKLTVNEWQNKLDECKLLQEDFDRLMATYSTETISYVKWLVDKRKKTRQNIKLKKREAKKRRKIIEENNKKTDNDIDNHLRNMKENLEKIKLDKQAKEYTDLVLFEVNKKKVDARKQLSLISALIKLRTVRESMGVQRGEKMLLEDKKAFNVTTEQLIKMWENRIKAYKDEEDELRCKLEENACEEKLEEDKNIIDEWESVLFGEKCEENATYWALTASERYLDTFVAVRRSWDTFLDSKKGSKIPIGWVLPNGDPNQNWNKYIVN